MPPNTFEAEIFSFPHTYTKLTFGTAGIKKLDKVISTYKIPDGEQIVAYMKGTIPLFGLTTEGTIITDCALYIHPCHDDWAATNRFPFSEICRYAVYMKDPKSDVYLARAEQVNTILGCTLFGKSVGGMELTQFIRSLQAVLLEKYDWAREQKRRSIQQLFAAVQTSMKHGRISDDQLMMLDNFGLAGDDAFSAKLLRAEDLYRSCNSESYDSFVNALPYLYITGYGYATTVGSCWLAPLVEAGEGVNMSFLVKRQSKEKILSKIAQTTMVNRSRMRDVGDTRQDYEELDSAINSGLYLKDVMNRQGEDFYYMHTLIEVTAPDPETLEQRATEVEKLCVSVDMIARRCDYKNEQAFLSSLPILALDPDIERKARRNALTSGVAAAFPFASYELSDHNGIFLGLNLYNRSPVFLDPYDDYKYTNGNWWIGGSTGAGKTVTLQCLGGRLRQQGKRVIIIAPKKGHEFRPLCEKLGGLYLRMSPSSKDCPNLMAIRRKSLDSYAKLKNIAARDDSVLADKISQLIIWFALKKKDLSEEDKSRLDSSLVEVYGRYGITFDNSSIVDENGDFRTMPIISDWYDVLSQNPDTRYLSVVLSRYVTGSAAAMASRNNIDLDNKYIVLDLSGMPDDMIADGTFWATSIAYDLIMSCESDLSALLADELWSLVGATANPQAAGFVLEMVKTIRGLGGIAVTSTQGMQDLFGLDGGSYGKGILDASRIKLVMQMEEQEARLIQDKLNLSEDEVRQITRFRRGEGLLCIGYNHVPVAFHTTPKEYEAITTSPTDLRRGRSEYGDE